MNNLVVIAIVAIVVVGALLAVSRLLDRRSRSSQVKKLLKAGAVPSGSETRWRSVRVAPGLVCCKAAEKIAEQVFLASESPVLPLQDCTEANCRCKYIHLEDRRSGGDRRVELGELGAFLPANRVERRQQSGRRAADLAV
jgi:hypothetical protein